MECGRLISLSLFSIGGDQELSSCTTLPSEYSIQGLLAGNVSLYSMQDMAISSSILSCDTYHGFLDCHDFINNYALHHHYLMKKTVNYIIITSSSKL